MRTSTLASGWKPRGWTVAVVACLLGVSSAQVAIGDRLVDEGRFPEAVAAYESAFAADATDARALARFARAAVYLADALPAGETAAKERWFGVAAERAEQAARLAPDDPDAHFEIARALGRLAQYRGVLASLHLAGRVAESLERAIELDPDHAGAWHARALFHHQVPWIAGGRSGQVIRSFERAIAIEPDVIAHRLELARVWIDRKDTAAAKAQLQAAVAIAPRTFHDRLDLEQARTLLATLP
jgi:tetratricopeptide (TPR) repeat protein